MTAGARDRRRLALLWLLGMDLRLPILALPPLLPLIHDDLGLNETAVAALTGLPVLLFALIAVPGAVLIARLGAHRAAMLGIFAVALGSALRGLGPSAAMLFAMTFVMGAGVSVIHPALPGLVGQWFGTRPAFATAVYANGLLMGEVLGAALTRPVVLPVAGGRWEWAFAFWGVPVLLTGLLMMAGGRDARGTSARANSRWWPDWRDRHTWQLGLVQGGGSVLYFGSNAFLPDYLHAIGRLDLLNACLTALNAGQLPASFVLLLLGDRLAGRKAPFIAAALIALLGLAGLFVPVPAVMIAASAVIGCVGRSCADLDARPAAATRAARRRAPAFRGGDDDRLWPDICGTAAGRHRLGRHRHDGHGFPAGRARRAHGAGAGRDAAAGDAAWLA